MSGDLTNRKTWIDYLGEEDLAFVKRFVLASGSLKEMARAYGISYPTVRLRLDRLIEKIKVVEDHQIVSPFERMARAQYAEGKIDIHTLKLLLEAHREELENRHETSDRM
ncbi:MAG: DUF2089 family protein [Planctomycetota bacterium]